MAAEMKRGQVAIWVILGLALVGSIILFFLLSRDSNILTPEPTGIADAKSFIRQCVSEHTKEVVNEILPRGGFLAPRNSIFYNEYDVEYICENVGFYHPCTIQHPVLIREMEKEIYNYVYPRAEECFSELKTRIEDDGGTVSIGSGMNIEIELVQDKIDVNIERNVNIEKRGVAETYDNFEFSMISPAYNLGAIALEIASQESQYCNFENVGYSILYPRYEIMKYTMSVQPVEIYTIKDLQTDKFMNIAVRSCASPPGI